MNPAKSQKGEIATILTLLSVGLMLAGMFAGKVAVPQRTQMESLAINSSICPPECPAGNWSCVEEPYVESSCCADAAEQAPYIAKYTNPIEAWKWDAGGGASGNPICGGAQGIEKSGPPQPSPTTGLPDQINACKNDCNSKNHTVCPVNTYDGYINPNDACNSNGFVSFADLNCADGIVSAYGRTDMFICCKTGCTAATPRQSCYYCNSANECKSYLADPQNGCADNGGDTNQSIGCLNGCVPTVPPPAPSATPATSANGCTFDITEVSPSGNDCVVVININGTADITGGGVGCAVSDMSGGKPAGNWHYCSWRGNDVVSGGMKYYFNCDKATTGLQLKAFKFGVCQDVDPHPFVYQPPLSDTVPTPATPPQTTAKCTAGNNACLNAIGPHKCCDSCDITENGEWGNSCAVNSSGQTTACSDKTQSQGFVLRCYRDDQDGNRWKWIHQYPQCVPNTSCSAAGPIITGTVTGTTGTIVPTQPAAGCDARCARCIWDKFNPFGGNNNDYINQLQQDYCNPGTGSSLPWITKDCSQKVVQKLSNRPVVPEVTDCEVTAILNKWCSYSNDCPFWKTNTQSACYSSCAGAPTLPPGPTLSPGAVAATLTPNPTLTAGGYRERGVLIVQGKQLITKKKVIPDPASIDIALSASPYSPLGTDKIIVDIKQLISRQDGSFVYPLNGTSIKTLGFLSKEPLPASLKLLDSSGNNLGIIDYDMAYICYPSYTVNASTDVNKLLADCKDKINVIDISSAIGINPTQVPSNTPAPSATTAPSPTPADQYVFFSPKIKLYYPTPAVPSDRSAFDSSHYKISIIDNEGGGQDVNGTLTNRGQTFAELNFTGNDFGPGYEVGSNTEYTLDRDSGVVRSKIDQTKYNFKPTRFSYQKYNGQENTVRFTADLQADLTWCGKNLINSTFPIFYPDVDTATRGFFHKVEINFEVSCRDGKISATVKPLSGSSNETIQYAMGLWFKKLLNPLEMSAFIAQLTRTSGLQKQNWDICNPSVSICPRTITVKTSV